MPRKPKKAFEELSAEDLSKIKIEFAPGCFDNFEGSQDELDQLVKDITEMVRSGELQERARKLDPDDLSKEDLEILARAFENETTPRKLQ